MTDKNISPRVAALHALEASLSLQRGQRLVAQARQIIRKAFRYAGRFVRRSVVRKTAYAGAGALVALALMVGGLWWRLSSGPIAFDFATPWLSAALEDNFGGRHRVEIGGTQIERDETGSTALRIRDIVVRDADGAIVASAPKADISIAGSSLLSGRLRAKSLSLVGAELAVRIEQDGQITISTGAERRPLAITPPVVKTGAQLRQGSADRITSTAVPAGPGGIEQFAALLGWIDRLNSGELEIADLREIGLRNGNLTVDDLRTSKKWTFEQINVSISRPGRGGIVLKIGSDSVRRPWVLTGAMAPPGAAGQRVVQVEAHKVSTKDILLALRMDEGQFQADVPVSGIVRAEIDARGVPLMLEGRLIAEAGKVGDPDNPLANFEIEKGELTLDWDASRGTLIAPFQVVAEGNRITLLAQFKAPRGPDTAWRGTLAGGSMVLTSAATPLVPADPHPLILNRVLVRANLDLVKRRLEVEQGDIGNNELGVAFSGSIDFSGEPRLAAGLAGTRMPVAAMKRIWPVFVASKVRNWVVEHVVAGTAERMVVAANAPLVTLREGGPPIPDDGLSVEVITSGTVVAPIEGLPAVRDADLTVRITGRTAAVSLGRGTVELQSGRKLSMTNGLFEIPDTYPKGPATRTRFKVDGTVPAAAELLTLERLKDSGGVPIDPATSRGTVSGNVTLAMPLKPDLPKGTAVYTVDVDLTNFAADDMVMGQKVEAALLRVSANPKGFQIKGDAKVGGAAGALEYRRMRGDTDAEVRFTAVLDETARARMGFDLGPAVTGAVPVRLGGRIADEGESRFKVEADLLQAKLDNLLPGWIKPPGKASRLSFTLVSKSQSTRFEDIAVDGPGTQVRGNLEIDSAGEIVSANFPIFALSDGDKTSIKVDRASDGALRVVMRGDVYDGRGFVKSALSGAPTTTKSKKPPGDLDLDIKLGTVAGFNGESLRGLDVKFSRRAGQIRHFTLNGKLGRDTALIGDLRRSGTRPVIYLETSDAGAFFRYADSYAKMFGGQMWVAIDTPTGEETPQEGLLNIRDFTIRGEAALDRVATSGGPNGRGGVEFSRLRVEFSRLAGRLNIREGVVRGPAVGATIDGVIDYTKNEVRMRGTFVPLYGLNNVFGQIPIVGLILGGGSNEGLVGITFEVVGAPNAPVLRVNPISAVAPGVLRKFFEFPGANDRVTQDPQRN